MKLGTPDHSIARGVQPFTMKEEFYYNLRFKPKDESLKPIWVVPALNGREPDGRIVAWARERPEGGRGFGTTAGHFYDNWKHASFRKLLLNALVWTAKVEVPADGVEAKFYERDEITKRLAGEPIRVLLLAGNDAHKWHNWERTTPAIQALLERDPRIQVTVTHDVEDLAKKLGEHDVLVQNYCNWHDPKGISPTSREVLVKFLSSGGGLVVVHFANGAFNFSLPKAGESDWPEYRKMVRRVWNHHGKSGHDSFGAFKVEPTDTRHAITAGLKSFEVTDELYFRQEGDEAIEPLIQARSKATGQDEPLAWSYFYGKGRVFQTLLGHSEKTYETYEPREMLRRAVAWAAAREVRVLDAAQDKASAPMSKTPAASDKNPLVAGRFGQGLDPRIARVAAADREDYRKLPFTLECWAKLSGKQSYNILVASQAKSSPTHWELFTMPASGRLTAYLPGMTPDHIHSEVDVCDNQWHALALVCEAERLRLYVDGRQVAEQAVKSGGRQSQAGPLAFGSLVGGEMVCDGLLDDVRLSKIARKINQVPSAALAADEATIGLWSFDTWKDRQLADASPLANPAKASGSSIATPAGPTAPQGPTPPPGNQLHPADARLKATLIDRSPGDVYLAVKVDSLGRLFVGGREAVYVFEPDDHGGYKPRQEVCRFPPDSIIIGLEFRGDDLYALTDNALYLLRDGRVRREGIKPDRLVWGLPLDLHVSFHCLAWGPEGDLYLNHGDPLLNASDFNRPDHWGHWTLYSKPGGTKTLYTGQGAVLRVRPDGSNLRVVATGLRGPVGLAFDRHWNLFTNDNDHESRADQYAPCKLLHVTPGIDFGWPRGWMASKSPNRSDLIEPIVSNLGRGVPCDLAWYDESLLPAEYQRTLLMDRWDQFTLNRYALRARGASFAGEEQPLLAGKNLARPVGVAVGRDGRIFCTALYLGGNVWSPYCASDLVMVTRADDSPELPFESFDLAKTPADKLWKELSGASWERRSRAHQEILRRGDLLDEATRRLASAKSDDLAMLHLPWLAAASGSESAAQQLKQLARHPQAELRLQAIRAFAEFPRLAASRAFLTESLADADPAVQLAALGYFLQTPGELPLAAILPLAASNDLYLRQTACRLLAQQADGAELAKLLQSPEAPVRLAGVLSLGERLTVPRVDENPPAELPLAYAHGNAKFKQHFADATEPVDLKALARIGSYTMASRWKALKPSDKQQADFALLLASLEDRDERVQQQAAYWLSLLNDPRSEPAIARLKLAIQVKGLAGAPVQPIARAWSVGPFSDTEHAERFTKPHAPEEGAIDLAVEYAGKLRWQEAAAIDGRFDRATADRSTPSSSYLYFRLQSVSRQAAVLAVGKESTVKIWHNGRAVHSGLGTDIPLDVQPGSNDLLVRVAQSEPKEKNAGVTLTVRAKSGLTVALPERLDSSLLAERLKSAGGAEKISAEFQTVDWAKALTAGDLANGRKLFGTLGCAKCHAIAPDQQGGGAPSLAEARKRFTVPHVVESVLLPSKQIAEPFRGTTLSLASGQILSGLVVGETAEQIEMLLPDASRKHVKKADIDERSPASLSPMPVGLVKNPQELADLLRYVLSENPAPP